MVPVSGEIWMDAGAISAVRHRAKSLFSAGIVRVTGKFGAQDCVLLCDAEGNAFAQGLTNYSSDDIFKLKVICAKMLHRPYPLKWRRTL